MGMRVVEVQIDGKKYELTFSNRVMMRLEQEKVDAETFTGMIVMLSAMMEAGDKLARHEGREGKGFLTVDELADFVGPQVIGDLAQAMAQAQEGERHVEALDDPKNGNGTPSGA